MRGIRAAVFACLGAWSACSFRSPNNGGGDDGDDSGSASIDAPSIDAPAADAPRCVLDGTYKLNAVTGHRYKVLTATVNYDTAIDLCTADGAHLAVVNDAAENTALMGILTAAGGGDAWLGFDDLTVEGVFKWVTGATGANLFIVPEPNNTSNEDCTAFRIDGTWHDQGCEDDKRPLCECDPMYRPPPTPTCRSLTANSFERSGRRVFRGPAATWADANAACKAMGAHLVVIGDVAKNDEMAQVLTGANWIGYTDAVTEGQFAWVNESPATYNRWPGGTVPANDGEDCAVIQDDGAWADVDCATTNAYACECDPLPP
ncbi:MAG TPA: C-type lectin domain-containing protein [Kofleriaceae bacterium]|nr:C-type lectin domain-containing protein [Kofleriaceae bacterium]